ncbi:MAG TPA: RidA family protein [Acidimicrobiales bacterium]|nr:RidA family protein [Acidimicrobiales bacterium]
MSGLHTLFEVYPEAARATLPLGLRVEDLVVAGGINGCDPETGEPVGGLEEQVAAAYQKMAFLMESAGGSLDNVGRAVAYVTDIEHREPVNGQWWEAVFPDPADRPAYKVILAELPPGELVRLDFVGVLNARRTRFDLPGIPARDPTVRIGEMIFSSRCHGIDGATGELAPGGLVPEAARTFQTLRELAVAAGGSPHDIVQLNAFGKTADYIAPARAEFARAFADIDPKPAFNPLVNFITPRFEISVEMIAVVGGQR